MLEFGLVRYRPLTGCGCESLSGFTGLCSSGKIVVKYVKNNIKLNLRFQIGVFIIFKVTVIQMKYIYIYIYIYSQNVSQAGLETGLILVVRLQAVPICLYMPRSLLAYRTAFV
jgi:hypothetical protein